MDSKLGAKFRRILLEEKKRIIANTKKSIESELNISADDLPDEVDLAAIQVNQTLVFRLRDRERQLLAKIDQAIVRLNDGTFGHCLECDEAIEKRRLEVRPVSTLCISCKELQEHREKVYA